MASTISQRFELEGLEEAIAKLKELASAGSEAFKKMSDAADKMAFGDKFERDAKKATDAMRGMGQAAGGIVSSLGNMADTIVNAGLKISAVFGVSATVGFVGLARAIEDVSKSSAKAASDMGSLAQAFGTGLDDMTGLVSVFNEFGVNTGDLGVAFRNLARRAATDWPQITKEIEQSADKSKQNVLSVQQAQLALAESTRNLINSTRDLAQAREKADQEAAGSKLSLQEAEFALQTLQGHPPTEAQQKQFQMEQAELRVKQARLALEQADQKAQQEREEAANKALQAQLDTERKQLDLAQARRKAREDELNDINNLMQAVQRFAAGNTAAFDTVNASVENLAKGIIASSSDGIRALGGFSGSLTELLRTSPNAAKALSLTADVIANMSDPLKQLGLLVNLFGRDVAEKMLPVLRLGSAEIARLAEESKALGLGFTVAEKDAGKAFDRLLNSFKSLAEDLKNKVGIDFAPIGTNIMAAISDTLKEHLGDIRAFFATFKSEVVEPAAQALINLIKGISFGDFAAKSKLDPDKLVNIGAWQRTFTSIKDGLIEAGAVIVTFFGTVLPAVIGAVRDALAGVTNQIEKFTGIKIDPDALGLTLLLFQMTGINKAAIDLGGAMINLGAAFLVAGAALGGAGGLLALVGGLAAVFLLAAAAASIWGDSLSQEMTKVTGAAGKLAKGDVLGAGTDLFDALFGSPEEWGRKLGQVWERLSKLNEIKLAVMTGQFKKAGDLITQLWEDATRKSAAAQNQLTSTTQQETDKQRSLFGNFGPKLEENRQKLRAMMNDLMGTTGATNELANATNRAANAQGRLADGFSAAAQSATGMFQSSKMLIIDVTRQLQVLNEQLEKTGVFQPRGPGRGPKFISAPKAAADIPVLPHPDDRKKAVPLNIIPEVPPDRAPLPLDIIPKVPEDTSPVPLPIIPKIPEDIPSVPVPIIPKIPEDIPPVPLQIDPQGPIRFGELLDSVVPIVSEIETAWNSVTTSINTATSAVQQFASAAASAASAPSGGSTIEAASGGLIGGRGTGTSDSNLAWVSRGEHIMPARAVRQPGVLAFLEMLRRSGGDLERVIDRMGRFALGGLVIPRAFPAFAEGGLVGHSNVTIQFPGLPPITGLRASADTIGELRRAAGLAQVRSGGRKPSRYS